MVVKLVKITKKNQTKFNKKNAGITNARKNMAHRVSKKIVEQPVKVIACENLKLTNMTKRPAPKQDELTGKYLPNGAARKSGLNKSILNVGIGRILNFVAYKAKENNKVLLKVSAKNSSRECSLCGYTNQKNRLTQDKFICQSCDYKAHADFNSTQVLKKRCLVVIRTGKFVGKTKTVKTISVRRKNLTKAPTEERCQLGETQSRSKQTWVDEPGTSKSKLTPVTLELAQA